MKRKIVKIVLIFTLLLTIFNSYTVVQADIINPLNDPSNYDPKKSSEQVGSDKLVAKVEHILGVINVVGVVVAIIILMFIGIKYMVGSVEEKAEYKSTMMAYLIGAILLFSITTIANVLYKLANSTF